MVIVDRKLFDFFPGSLSDHLFGSSSRPRFECLEMALKLNDECPTLDLSSLKPIIEDGLKNLESRGQHQDGNAPGRCPARLLIVLFEVVSSVCI